MGINEINADAKIGDNFITFCQNRPKSMQSERINEKSRLFLCEGTRLGKRVKEEFGSWMVVSCGMGILCTCPLIPMGSQNSDNTDYF